MREGEREVGTKVVEGGGEGFKRSKLTWGQGIDRSVGGLALVVLAVLRHVKSLVEEGLDLLLVLLL